MSERHDIDSILRSWAYKPGVISARLVRAEDGREVLQMRVELGVLQMELKGRPDGRRPGGAMTYLDTIARAAARREGEFRLNVDQCLEIDREFLQYYHRRVCCLALRLFDRAMADAEHTLKMMDFVTAHSPDARWTASHEQYRPFVLFHRAQAATMVALQQSGAEAAMEEVERGLREVRASWAASEAEHDIREEELVSQLQEMKDSLREEYQVGTSLSEQLNEAVAAEQYERAAELRDEIRRRRQS